MPFTPNPKSQTPRPKLKTQKCLTTHIKSHKPQPQSPNPYTPDPFPQSPHGPQNPKPKPQTQLLEEAGYDRFSGSSDPNRRNGQSSAPTPQPEGHEGQGALTNHEGQGALTNHEGQGALTNQETQSLNPNLTIQTLNPKPPAQHRSPMLGLVTECVLLAKPRELDCVVTWANTALFASPMASFDALLDAQV
jgi:hypothetical protein